MKKAKLGDVFYYAGQLTKVEWVNNGYRSIGFKVKDSVCCPKCGCEVEYDQHMDVIEDSPMFQENAEPVKTITI